jgi:NodT family efflux transporter outer membrane factor (OMF) lipoprotein
MRPRSANATARRHPREASGMSAKIAAPHIAVAALALALSACAVGPDFAPPDPPAGAGYVAGKVGGAGGQKLVSGRDVPGEWWKLFHSPQITAFVTEAVNNHPDIVAAEAALRQARETVEADSASFLPQLSATQTALRQQATSVQYGGLTSSSSVATAYRYSLHNTNVAVSFSPDVFGKVQRTVEGDEAAADYQRFQLEAAYLALTANVVTAAIADASYAEQIRVTHELIESWRKQLDILDKRFALGAVSQADVLAERAQLAQAQATLPPLEKARAQTRNQLMAYLGRLPNADRGEAVSLASLRLPPKLPLSLPSALTRQRPDLGAAEAQLHKATADVGVATANMFPQLTLSPSGGSQASNFAMLFTPQTSVYALAVSASAQLFDAGALFRQREAKLAALERAEAQYRSAVIVAFQNVADALSALKQDAAALAADSAAEAASAQSLTIARAQYAAGATTYPTVLTAEQSLMTARLNRVRAQASRLADTTALLQALGGGWWNRVDETPAAQPKPLDPISLIPVAAAIRAEAEDAAHAR